MQTGHFVEAPSLVGEERRLTSGAIDLLYRRGDGWQLVDYKTDVTMAPEAYAAQLDAYLAALAVVGCGVDEAQVSRVRMYTTTEEWSCVAKPP